MAIQGIDVSNNNGSVNWDQVEHAGFKFAIIKLNEGIWTDPFANKARVDAIRRNNLIVGGYDFLRPRKGRRGADEFDYHYEIARRAGLYKKGDLRPVVDVEATAFNDTPWGRWQTRRYITSWVERCFKVTGHHPIIYTGFFWRDYLNNWPNNLHCHNLWYPSYPRLSNWPRAWRRPTLHQYSETGHVPGVNGLCDLTRYLGRDMSTFKKSLCLQFGRK